MKRSPRPRASQDDQPLTPEEFEAIWEKSQTEALMVPQPITPVQIDLSLTRILDQYVRLADRYFSEGEITKENHDALIEGVGRLKPILTRLGDRDLVQKDFVRRAELRLYATAQKGKPSGKKKGKAPSR